MVEEFLKFLGQDSKISHTQTETTFGRFESYSASSMRGVPGLVALGIKSDPAPDLYTSRHFWRGMVDGDGSVFVTGRGLPTVSLCGDIKDVEAFSRWVGGLFGYDGPKVSDLKRNCWIAGVGGGRGRALGVYLYAGSYSAVLRKSQAALAFEALRFRTSTRLLRAENK